MTMEFPRALSDALGLPGDTPRDVLEFLKAGWDKLSQEEKLSLFEEIRSKSDFDQRILTALRRLNPVVFPRASN